MVRSRQNFQKNFHLSITPTKMNDLKLSLVQCNLIWEDKSQNLTNIRRQIIQEDSHTDIILLPEMFSTGFTMNPAPMAE